MCGATLPPAFVAQLSANDDPDWQYQVGVEFATRQVRQLVQQGVPGIHFYVLNKSQATLAVLQAVDSCTACRVASCRKRNAGGGRCKTTSRAGMTSLIAVNPTRSDCRHLSVSARRFFDGRHFASVQEAGQRPAAIRLLQLADGLRFDLADAFPRDREDLAHFFQRVRSSRRPVRTAAGGSRVRGSSSLPSPRRSGSSTLPGSSRTADRRPDSLPETHRSSCRHDRPPAGPATAAGGPSS